MDLYKLFNKLKDVPKPSLPSAQERMGIRTAQIPYTEILRQKNLQEDADKYFGSAPAYFNQAARELQKESAQSIPDGTQLDMFATTGGDAFKDMLNSDAVTGSTLEDISKLDAQFTATNPGEVANILSNGPDILQSVNNSNATGDFSNLGTAGTLIRLYQILKSIK